MAISLQGDFSYAGIDRTALQLVEKNLYALRETMYTAWQQKYKTPYSFLWVPFDDHALRQIKNTFQEKSFLKPSLVVVVGIGSSNLGTVAVMQGLYGTFYNELRSQKIYFVDTVDAAAVHHVLGVMQSELQQGKNVSLIVITKSGTTTETLANGLVFPERLKVARPHDYQRSVVVITQEDSPLATVAKKQNMSVLPIAPTVGGRFSVFSAVGLLPLMLVGVNVDDLVRGAQDTVILFFEQPCPENTVMKGALAHYLQYTKGKVIHDFFTFSSSLLGVGSWWRQLMGESLGKKTVTTGQAIGITPTVSVGSTDLHSVGQLYLGGVHDKFFTFVTTAQQPAITVPVMPAFNNLNVPVQGKSLTTIVQAIIGGVQRTYAQQKIPFMTLALSEVSAYSVGQLLQWYMIEVVVLAALLEVNPFDQPAVELYKQEMRKLLAP